VSFGYDDKTAQSRSAVARRERGRRVASAKAAAAAARAVRRAGGAAPLGVLAVAVVVLLVAPWVGLYLSRTSRTASGQGRERDGPGGAGLTQIAQILRRPVSSARGCVRHKGRPTATPATSSRGSTPAPQRALRHARGRAAARAAAVACDHPEAHRPSDRCPPGGGDPRFQRAQHVDLTRTHPLAFGCLGFRSGAPLEGFLFPATYEVSPSISPALRRAATRRLPLGHGRVDLAHAAAKNLTDYECRDYRLADRARDRGVRRAAAGGAVIWNGCTLRMRLQMTRPSIRLPTASPCCRIATCTSSRPTTPTARRLPRRPRNPDFSLRAARHPAGVDSSSPWPCERRGATTSRPATPSSPPTRREPGSRVGCARRRSRAARGGAGVGRRRASLHWRATPPAISNEPGARDVTTIAGAPV